ncbi:MAG TPA: phosphatase PAP2 family protein [Mycobacteriales bacterium]|nr:phosphatase PAP2 family protein [Mycobacteriales bacterium]
MTSLAEGVRPDKDEYSYEGDASRGVATRRERLRSFPSRLIRRRGLRELLLVAIVYAVYDTSRFFVEGRQSTAFAHAVGVLHIEDAMDLAWEQTVNNALAAHSFLAVSADYLYATLHYIVTPLVLVWLWRRHRSDYSRARTTLMVATILGLIGFTLLPVAPPRMLPGFVDTMAKYSNFGWWSQDASAPRGVGRYTNEFAAMPSLHVGWALWCGWQLVRHGRRRMTQIAGVVYPALMVVVVVGTGNHYLLDAVAGIAVVVLAGMAVGGVQRLRPAKVIDLNAHRVIDLTDAAQVPAPRTSATA